MKLLIALFRGAVCYLGMTLNGLIGTVLLFVSGGKLRRFNAEVLSPLACGLMLRLIGIRFIPPSQDKFPSQTVMYIFNHNSYLDIFMIPCLRLPKTRAIISTGTKKILPLFLSNLGIGALFIPFKNRPEQRLAFFNALIERLNRREDSVICAPEGVHTFRHQIAKFNRGIFHVACVTKTPLCPMFFHIPAKNNPLESYHFQAGTVSVDVLPVIETKDWQLENLDQHIADVRQIFLARFSLYYGEQKP